MVKVLPILAAAMLPSLAGCTGAQVEQTRGIGVYPGDPSESFAPELTVDDKYRNLALNRSTSQSSAYDFNLTSQLVTDGIVTDVLPPYLTVSTPEGPLRAREREWSLDGGPYSFNSLKGESSWLEYKWNAQEVEADTIEITGIAYHGAGSTGNYEIDVQVPGEPGWRTSGKISGSGWGKKARNLHKETDPNKQSEIKAVGERFTVAVPVDFEKTSDIRINFNAPGVDSWAIHEVVMKRDGEADRDILPSFDFGSAWMSNGGGEQWVSVDLGNRAEISEVILNWIEKPKSGQIEFSDDAVEWTGVAPLTASDESLTDTIAVEGKARYVRVLMSEPGKTGRYVLSEMQVMGRGGVVAVPKHVAGDMSHNGKSEYSLNGGAWRLARASEVNGNGEMISQPGFDDASWIVATVPATVLSSYINIGAVPNPNFSDNMFCISESYFNSNFWYRTEFDFTPSDNGERVFLNFDGINWKANVFLNGKRIDRIEGAFVRSKTDVTDLLKPGMNVLAVEIEKVAHPGAVKEKNIETTDFNGGMLGLDNPTFHATIGWDWISTVRGRNIGIWNDVYLTTAADVTLLDPVVTSTLAFGADTLATMKPCVIVANHAQKEITGTLYGWIGDIKFNRELTLAPMEETEVCFMPDEYAVLKEQKMNLWWPVGYGEPNLYDAGYEFVVGKNVADKISYNAGIREMTYTDTMTCLKLYVNGKRFIPLGGNWGFSEHNLNYRGREYDIAVKYHKDMNFNMIRNWVGQTGDEEFYEACDRHGVMVMQDFWLANPVDGPNQGNEDMFVDNAVDYVKRIRRHPSIAFYCGRNEGDPTPTLNAALESTVAAWNPGLLYIPNSADYGLTGHGPYGAEADSTYFAIQTGKFHSERGLPNVMTPEGLKRTFGPEIPWPQDDLWGQHDYTQKGAQRGASFNKILGSKIGMPDDGEMFGRMAQWENYDAYRAMFESSQTERMGLVIWMSHSCWPSLTWDTYDYYFEPTAAFFGSKKACEPLHVQWNPLTKYVQVVNIASGTIDNLSVEAKVLGIDGKEVESKSASISSTSDTTEDVFKISCPADITSPLFLRLTLKKGDKLLSENTYSWGAPSDGLKALMDLPEGNVDVSVAKSSQTSSSVTLKNNGSTVVPLVRLNLKGKDGDQILPVDYSDNYFHLMPGESRTVDISWQDHDARGEDAVVEISALNLRPTDTSL